MYTTYVDNLYVDKEDMIFILKCKPKSIIFKFSIEDSRSFKKAGKGF